MTFTRPLGLVIALAAAACGSGGGGEITLDKYSEALRDAQCNHLVQCGEVKDLATCRAAHLPGDPNAQSASTIAAVAMQRASFDAKMAAACVDALSQHGCDTTSEAFRATPAACLAVFTGTVHGGAACAQDIECISLACNAPLSCNEPCCVGTCAGDAAPGFAPVGAACGGPALCDPATSYCDQVTLTCTALKPAGGTCQSGIECAYGTDCDGLGTCRALPVLGQACAGVCRDLGTTCSATSNTCVKVGLEGAPCAASDDCALLYQCGADGTCTAGIALGQPCTLATPCAGRGTLCSVPDGQTQGTCVTTLATGAACSLDSDCQSNFCDQPSLTCQPQTVCLGNGAQPG